MPISYDGLFNAETQGSEIWLDLLAGADSAAVQYVVFLARSTCKEDLLASRWANKHPFVD